tara:strand:- start:282 stop:848 length:567 start_codon:yes stop_codon:yes gene_type:complete
MRIISGLFKGKKIIEPNDTKTRPLKDLTKESIFNIIEHSNKLNINLNESIILDLFSGVGSFGIECLSRGAKKVVFIENYSGVLPILKKNLADLKTINNYEIFERDIYKSDFQLDLNNKFNLIFLDPPYADKNINELLHKIIKYELLNDDGIIIAHRHKSEKVFFSSDFKIIDEKKYGVSKIFFLSKLN